MDRDLKINVLMWLEYAWDDDEYTKEATGLTCKDCARVAHQLLQGEPGEGVPRDGWEWATRVHAEHLAKTA